MFRYWLYLYVVCVCLGIAGVSPSGFAAEKSAAKSSLFRAFIPAGWALFDSKMGDLNADNRDDAVLVLEQADPANLQKNPGPLGAEELNLNPRRLLILLNKSGQLTPVVTTDHFIPPKNGEDTPCLEDPFETDSVQIKKGILTISLNYFLSCGSWGVARDTYTYRYEKGRFRLIGQDHHDFMRNSGEATERSINYLNGKIKTTEGLNEFEPSRPKITWTRLQKTLPQFLENGAGLPPPFDDIGESK